MAVNFAAVPTKSELCDFDRDNHGAVILRVRKDYRGLCPKSMLMCLQGQYPCQSKILLKPLSVRNTQDGGGGIKD